MRLSSLFSSCPVGMSCILLATALTCSAAPVKIIAHRGASYDAPENTLAAFKLGYQQNADGDEIDIYLSKDGKIVVNHDKDTLRTGGVKKKVVDQTFEELRALDVGNWGQWQGKFSEKMPTIEEVIAIVPKGKLLVVEIKCGPEIVPQLKKTLKNSGLKPEQIYIIGFGYDTVKAVKKAMPEYCTFWLHSWKKNEQTQEFPKIEDLIAKAKAAKLDGLNLDYHFPIDKAFVQKVKAANLRLLTWTVDDPVVAQQEIDAGVEAITTNRPEWLRKQLGL